MPAQQVMEIEVASTWVLSVTSDLSIGLTGGTAGSHRSSRALEDAIRVYVATHNTDPKPFVWVKSADEILANISRFALRTYETGH